MFGSATAEVRAMILRTGLFVGFCIAILARLAPPVKCQAGTQVKNIQIELKQPSLDAEVLAVAKAAHVNFVLDAHDLSNPGAGPDINFKASLSSWLQKAHIEYGLVTLQSAESTFLLWSPPTLTDLTALLRSAPAASAGNVPPPDVEWKPRLMAYLRTLHGWRGAKDAPEIKLKVRDLPSGIRSAILALIQERAATQSSGYVEVYNGWFQEQTWKNARLRMKSTPANGTQLKYLAVEADIGNGGRQSISISFLDALSRDVALYRAGRLVPQSDRQEAVEAPEESNQVMDRSAPGMLALDLPADGALLAKVSLDSSRTPLKDLLVEVSGQTQTTLTAAPDFPAVDLTVHCEGMPVVELMRAISRLHGVRWQKKGDAAYVLLRPVISSFERVMMRLGDPSALTGRVLGSNLAKTLGPRVAVNIQRPELLETSAGIPCSTLPADVQLDLLRFVQQHSILNLASKYQFRCETCILDQGYIAVRGHNLIAGLDSPVTRIRLADLDPNAIVREKTAAAH